jgi:FAD/FMN-containing dehydrogenase
MISQTPKASLWQQWETVMPGRVFGREQAQNRYSENTLGKRCSLLGALLPQTVEEVRSLLLIANQHQVSLYPLSTGRNWGYGSSLPVRENCVIVDLSYLNKIRAFDPILGLVTLEPGVTQQQLHTYLKEHHYPFWVPVTGAGPNTSIVGNALERGYGLVPQTDHFYAVNAIEALLPNGKLYQTPLTLLGGAGVDQAYKWGVGPYVDGLFSQGNFGIVTAMTVGLVRVPASQEMFLFHLDTDSQLIEFVDDLRRVIQTVGNHLGTLKITTDEGRTWLGVGTVYGEKPITNAVKKLLKKTISKRVRNLQFIQKEPFQWRKRMFNYLFPSFASRLKRTEFFSMWSGEPSEIALQFLYRKLKIPTYGRDLNPDHDGCGLIWFSPLLPMLSSTMKTYLDTVQSIMTEYKFPPVITFSCLSGACFDSTVPILFSKENQDTVDRAHACYEALFLACQKHGFLPYRYPIHFLHRIVDAQSPYWQLVSTLKRAVDPYNIVSPGRYCL